MKRIILGDIHGNWKSVEQIYYKENPDEIIILGDYFDSFNQTPYEICECFENILTLRKLHIEKNKGDFIMILGNHDYHYIFNEHYSGWNINYAGYAKTKLEECLEKHYIQYIYIDNINRIIYSHAGVTNTWLNETCKECPLEFVNNLSLDKLRFTYKGGGDCYGNTIYSSPIWVRPNALYIDGYKDNDGKWTQIVGHTHNNNIIVKDNNYYIIDSLPFYYIRETLDNNKKLINREIINNDK